MIFHLPIGFPINNIISLAAYDRKVEVWVSSRHNIPKNLLDDLESPLNSSSAKVIPHNESEGVEGMYWEGTEAGLMGILLFPGLIYGTDGSPEKGNMGAFTGTKAEREASAQWAETRKAHPPSKRKMQRHASPLKTRDNVVD